MASKKNNSDIAYIIPSKYEGVEDFKVRKTANAWWINSTKVHRLFDAFDNHKATIDEACRVAGISIRQYKYFAQMHPSINTRRKASRYLLDPEKRMEKARAVLEGKGLKAAWKYLTFTQPEEYDLRYRGNPLSKLKRRYGIPANPKPKSEEQRRAEMEEKIEKTRKMLLQPSEEDSTSQQ